MIGCQPEAASSNRCRSLHPGMLLSPNSPPFWLSTVQRRQPVSHAGRGTQDLAYTEIHTHTLTHTLHIRARTHFHRLGLRQNDLKKHKGCDVAEEDCGCRDETRMCGEVLMLDYERFK